MSQFAKNLLLWIIVAMVLMSIFQHYAETAYRLPPKTYHLSTDARRYFDAWFRKHQATALLPATPPVIRSMLMKTSAQALRLAGVWLPVVHLQIII